MLHVNYLNKAGKRKKLKNKVQNSLSNFNTTKQHKSKQCDINRRKDIDQWKRTENPEINLINFHLTFNKSAKTIRWEKNHHLNK